MLITRNILNKALEDKVPLFHDGITLMMMFCMICFMHQQNRKYYLMVGKAKQHSFQRMTGIFCVQK